MAEFDKNSQDVVNNDVATDKTDVVDTGKVEETFKVFKTQKDFDDFSAYLIKKGEEKALKNAKVKDGESTFDVKEYEKKYRKDLEAQIIADYEKKQKMTAEERAEALAQEREQQFKERETALNKREAKVLLSEAGFDEDDMDVYLDFVNEDRETSLGKIHRVCESQKAKLKKQRESIINELQANSPNMKLSDGSEVNALQARYDQANAIGDVAAKAGIIREAQVKNIKINF